MQVRQFGIRIGVGLILGLVLETLIAQAQTLPPPPPPTGSPSLPLPAISPAPGGRVPIETIPNERVYTAPRVNSGQSISGGFRVFVESSSPVVLQQVRAIQPDAFIQTVQGRRVIQAGLFSDELKARQLISRLAAQDIPAQITGRSPQSSQPGLETGTQRGYYAVVPGDRSEVQDYCDRAIRLGVSQALVQLRDRPRGLHLAVGPFTDRREAEQMVDYLRDRGSLDARLFYDR